MIIMWGKQTNKVTNDYITFPSGGGKNKKAIQKTRLPTKYECTEFFYSKNSLPSFLQQHEFSTHKQMFLGKCCKFWDRKCLDMGGFETPSFGFKQNALHLELPGPYICYPIFGILAVVALISRGALYMLRSLWCAAQHYGNQSRGC